MTTQKRDALGRGLDSLLRNTASDALGRQTAQINSISEINLSQIDVNPFQPRTDFNAEALEELADSIRVHGFIQPLTVRKMGHGRYELISGERRLRASQSIGLTSVPAYVRVANDQSMLELALMENIHRENLNPIDVAISYQRLIEECDLNQEDLAGRIGKNRTTVTNSLRLLRLPSAVQLALRDGKITPGLARPLLSLEGEEAQLEMLKRIIDNGLSARQVEELLKKKSGKAKPSAKKTAAKSPIGSAFAKSLQDKLGAKVSIKSDAKGGGKIAIHFKNDRDLARLQAFLSPEETQG